MRGMIGAGHMMLGPQLSPTYGYGHTGMPLHLESIYTPHSLNGKPELLLVPVRPQQRIHTFTLSGKLFIALERRTFT